MEPSEMDEEGTTSDTALCIAPSEAMTPDVLLNNRTETLSLVILSRASRRDFQWTTFAQTESKYFK